MPPAPLSSAFKTSFPGLPPAVEGFFQQPGWGDSPFVPGEESEATHSSNSWSNSQGQALCLSEFCSCSEPEC